MPKTSKKIYKTRFWNKYLYRHCHFLLYIVKGSFITVKTFSFLELSLLFLPGFNVYSILHQRRHLCVYGDLPGKKKLRILMIKGELRSGIFFLLVCLKEIPSLKMELLQKKDVIMENILNSFSGLEIQLTPGNSNR